MVLSAHLPAHVDVDTNVLVRLDGLPTVGTAPVVVHQRDTQPLPEGKVAVFLLAGKEETVSDFFFWPCLGETLHRPEGARQPHPPHVVSSCFGPRAQLQWRKIQQSKHRKSGAEPGPQLAQCWYLHGAEFSGSHDPTGTIQLTTRTFQVDMSWNIGRGDKISTAQRGGGSFQTIRNL